MQSASGALRRLSNLQWW